MMSGRSFASARHTLVERRIELLIQGAHFKQFDVHKLQHRPHVIHVLSEDEGGIPVDQGGVIATE